MICIWTNFFPTLTIHTLKNSCRIHMPTQHELLQSHSCIMIWPVTMNNSSLHSFKETTGWKRNQKVKRGRNKDFDYSTGMTSWRQIQSSSRWMTDCKPVKFCLWIHPWPSKKIYSCFDLFSFLCLSLLTVFCALTFQRSKFKVSQTHKKAKRRKCQNQYGRTGDYVSNNFLLGTAATLILKEIEM